MSSAASQSKMNTLHDRVADMFIRVLQRYHERLDVISVVDVENITDEVLTALLDDAALPSPSMMAAITKFLKDNEVLFEKDKIDQISDQQRALAEKRKNRPNLATLTVVPMVSAG